MGLVVIARLVQDGIAGLALTDISGTRLAEAVASLPSGLPVFSLRGDVTRAEEAGAFCTGTLTALGRVDCLVNLVGGPAVNPALHPVSGDGRVAIPGDP
jgi:3-oxoacyl-[acyl-carrier protein] reductase